MAKAAISGIGMTSFGEHEKPLEELFDDAVTTAMDDAGVGGQDVDALYVGNAMGGQTENETHLSAKFATYLGLVGVPAQRFEDACATSSNAFKHAVQAVESGTHDVVIAGGVERVSQTTGIGTPEMTRIFGSGVHRQYEQPPGLTAPSLFGMMTRRHMHEYGTTVEQLAEVAVKNHHHGNMNDRAQFGDRCSVQDVLDSPDIADPFHLLDCCPFSDGASAVVVTNQDVAASSDSEPIDVLGIGHATDSVPLAEKDTVHQSLSTKRAAREAYEQASVGPEDIDAAEVHDCFTGAELLAIEGLGLVEEGGGGPATEAGRTYIDGDIPINPSGGLKAKGHPIGATGTAQLVEMSEHLRGTAGDRQVEDAQTVATHNLGGAAATTIVTILGVGA